MFGGGVVFILSCLCCAIVKDINLFIIIRFFQGAAVCSVAVAGYAAIHESFEDKKAVKLIALMSMVSIWAPMLGPLIGGYAINYYNWQAIFILVMIITSLAMIGLYFAMPETLVNKNTNSMSVDNLIVEYKEVILNKQFMLYSVIFGLSFAGLFGWISVGPFYLMLQNNYAHEEFGYAQIPVFAGFIIGAQIVRICIDKLSMLVILKLGLLICCSGALIVLIVAIIDSALTTVTITGMSLYGIGFGTLAAPINRLAFNSTSGGKGVINAVYCSCLLLLGSLITLIISVIDSDSIIVFAVIINGIVCFSLIGVHRRLL